MAKIEHIKNKRGEVIYPVSKEGAIYDENGVLLSTKIATFITRLVDNLANYYLKSETYTKGEVDELIGAIQGFTYIVVSELPTASAETMGIVYLVPSEDPQTQNVKDEYITIRSGVEGSYTYSWEQIGSTAIDLSGYVTTEALNTALADYTTTANLTTLLAAKQDTIADLSTIRSGAAAGATAYQKPETGIPATDMASGVQTSLGKADSAYQKPSGGIPKTDLESGVQGSLELADSAVQADPIGSIVPPVDPSEFATKEEVEGLEAKVTGLEQTIDFSTQPYYVGNLSANGTWGNTTTYASKYSYFIIPYVQGAVVTITGNATNGTGIVYALDSYSTPSNGDTQTILGTYAPGANETISFVPPAGTIYIYVVRRYYDTSKDFTPALMKEKITGISESVEGLKENVGNIDDTLFGNEVSLMLTNYLYMNGSTIYTRADGFSVRYAQVKPGNYIVSFIGNGEITYADGVAVGYTTNAVANGNSYNPITKVEYRTGQLVEIPVTIPIESNIVIASWTAKVTNLVVRRMEYSHEYYGSLIKYVGTDINKTYTSLDTALDSVVAGQKTAILVSTGTYTLSNDWTSTEIENASYSDVAAGVADSWCGTPVKDGTSIIGINGKDKVIIYAELPASTPTYNEISALNLMGDVTLRGVTISSRRMRYPIHDDFKLYNANKTHNIIDCNLISYGNTPAYGVARSSGETINVENCYIEGFAIHASYEFLLPAFVNIKDTTITYSLNIGDHNTKVECPFNLSNVNVGVISYYKNSASDPQYVVLSIHGGNFPVIKGIEKYSHDGIIYRTTLTAAVSKGSPVKSDGLLNCVTMASGDDATKFIGIAMDDYAKVDNQNSHDFYPFIAKGYVPTTLVGITTFAVGDTVGVVNGAVVVSSSNVIGEIEYIDSGVGYIRLY